MKWPDIKSMTDRQLALAVLVILAVVIGVGVGVKQFSTPRAPQEVYVSLSGSDGNAGTAASPYRYLSTGVAHLRPGDRLCVGAGTWTDARDVIDSQTYTVPSGTDWSGGAITISGCNGDVPVLSPPNNMAAIRLTASQPHYLIVTNLTVDLSRNTVLSPNGGPAGIYLAQGAHHNRFQHLTVRKNVGSCVEFGNTGGESPFNELNDSVIQECGVGGTSGVNDGYGIYNFTNDTRITHNVFSTIGGYGVTSYGSRVVIGDNRISNTGVNGGTSYGIVVGSSAHPTQSLAVSIVNNLIDRNKGGGILLYTNSGDTRVLNNTITGNGLEAVGLQYYVSGSTIRNNIVWGNAAAIVDHGGTGPSVIDHNIETDPKFLDAANGDYRIGSSSSAYNTGVRLDAVTTDITGTPRPQAEVYDAGAFEVISSTPPPPTSEQLVLVSTLTATVQSITDGPTRLNTLICSNPPSGSLAFVQLFDGTGALRVGTTAPAASFSVEAGRTLPLTQAALPFRSALRAAATRTALGTEAPALPLACTFGVAAR